MEPVIESLRIRLSSLDPGGVLGIYVFGSGARDALRPDSDIDLLMLTGRSLSLNERESLLTFLLQVSGRRATSGPARPLELTSLVLRDVVPWTYPPVCDFLYGEWLRDEYVQGRRFGFVKTNELESGGTPAAQVPFEEVMRRYPPSICTEPCSTPSPPSWRTWWATSATSS